MSRIFVLIVLIYTTTFSYGANCCCTSQTTKSSAAVVDYENITGYDLVSNVLSTQETYLGSAVASRTVTNGYDDVYRLLSEKAVAGSTTTTTSYTYDTANNRSTQEVQVVTGSNTTTTNTTYNYNNLDQVTSTTGALVASFGYDVDGNRTTQTIGTATNTYTYDAENRLVELVQGTGTGNGTYNYAYDYRSRRILRDESAAAGVLTQLVYSGGTSVQEYKTSDSSQSNLQVEFIRGSDYGGGVGGILYSLRGSTPSYTHANKRGDITAKTTSSGAITYLSQYQAFGDQVATSGTTQDRQKSNSKEQDPWGGHNEGMRYRDDFGFLTRDPAGMIDGPNEYTYVNQNPWTKFDPEGLDGTDGNDSPTTLDQARKSGDVQDIAHIAFKPNEAEGVLKQYNKKVWTPQDVTSEDIKNARSDSDYGDLPDKDVKVELSARWNHAQAKLALIQHELNPKENLEMRMYPALFNLTMLALSPIPVTPGGTAATVTREGSSEITLTVAQAKALNTLGVNQQDRQAFLNGGVVGFQYATKGGDPVEGFLNYDGSKLTSQLFSIKNSDPTAAAKAFLQFRNGSFALARSLNLNSVELQGGSVINNQVKDFLLRQGFQPKTVSVPEALGGGTQEVYSKDVPLN